MLTTRASEQLAIIQHPWGLDQDLGASSQYPVLVENATLVK